MNCSLATSPPGQFGWFCQERFDYKYTDAYVFTYIYIYIISIYLHKYRQYDTRTHTHTHTPTHLFLSQISEDDLQMSIQF